jgi:hypothetical protein
MVSDCHNALMRDRVRKPCTPDLVGSAKTTSGKKPCIGQRRPGGQPGNSNAWKHGRRSQRAEGARKLTCARLKLAAFILQAHALAAGREFQSHARPLRQDQMNLLRREDPEGWSIATSAF